jgi:hypothetical protein
MIFCTSYFDLINLITEIYRLMTIVRLTVIITFLTKGCMNAIPQSLGLINCFVTRVHE